MPPSQMSTSSYDHFPSSSYRPSVLETASSELEKLRSAPRTLDYTMIPFCEESSQSSSSDEERSMPRRVKAYSPQPTRSRTGMDCGGHGLPPACRMLLYSLPGNKHCVDCGDANPQWASLSYGILLCLHCSGRHRGFGVQVSKVRSITMDHWEHSQVLSMLEGGNAQLTSFFQRHSLTPKSPPSNNGASNKLSDKVIIDKRYKVKAAQFYRDQLALHVKRVLENGEYQGRDAARKMCTVERNDPAVKQSTIREPTVLPIQHSRGIPS